MSDHKSYSNPCSIKLNLELTENVLILSIQMQRIGMVGEADTTNGNNYFIMFVLELNNFSYFLYRLLILDWDIFFWY